MWFEHSELWAATIRPTEPSTRDNSSITIEYSRYPSPAPPYFSGKITPSSPSSPSCGMISCGNWKPHPTPSRAERFRLRQIPAPFAEGAAARLSARDPHHLTIKNSIYVSSVRALRGAANFTERRDRAINFCAVYIVMRDHAHQKFIGGAGQHVALAQLGGNLRAGLARFAHVENHNVGHNFLWIDRNAGDFRQPFREIFGVLMVAMQNFRRFLERDQSRCREHAGLAHPAAQHFAMDVRFFDEFARANQHRTHRRAQAFRQAEHHRIKFSREFV